MLPGRPHHPLSSTLARWPPLSLRHVRMHTPFAGSTPRDGGQLLDLHTAVSVSLCVVCRHLDTLTAAWRCHGCVHAPPHPLWSVDRNTPTARRQEVAHAQGAPAAVPGRGSCQGPHRAPPAAAQGVLHTMCVRAAQRVRARTRATPRATLARLTPSAVSAARSSAVTADIFDMANSIKLRQRCAAGGWCARGDVDSARGGGWVGGHTRVGDNPSCCCRAAHT
jgi:hypothetical protein